MVKDILGSIGAFPIFDNLVSRTRLAIEGNGVHLGLRGEYSVFAGVLLTVKCLRSFWGHWGHSDFRQPCISRTAGRRAKRSDIWASYLVHTCEVFSVYLLQVILGSPKRISNTGGLRAKHTPKSLCYPVLGSGVDTTAKMH